MTPSTPPDHPDRQDAALAARRRLLDARDLHWRRTRRMTAVLLALWLVAGFGTVFFARELAGVTLFGWPLPFYMAAQGVSLLSLAIIGVYAWRMRRLERCYAAALEQA
jgi:putative solute:sodium symporter small subunit